MYEAWALVRFVKYEGDIRDYNCENCNRGSIVSDNLQQGKFQAFESDNLATDSRQSPWRTPPRQLGVWSYVNFVDIVSVHQSAKRRGHSMYHSG